jgi:hypothetical protein
MKKKAHPVEYMWRMSVRPCYSVAFLVRADGLPPSRNGFRMKSANKANGLISKKAAARINNAMQWLLLFSHKKRVYSKATKRSYFFLINFITLTLSGKQAHEDEFIKRHMLYPFLRWLERSHKAGLYIWKAEAQKNGNIHFHITTNTFVLWKSIRRKWNEIQSKHGYLKKWTEGNVRGDPNSTDVHAVIKTEQIAKYMVKYMVKNDPTRRQINGALWRCSNELSNISICIDEHDTEFSESSATITRQSDIKKLDHATLLLHKPLNKLVLTKLLRDRLSEKYKSIRHAINTQTYFTTE